MALLIEQVRLKGKIRLHDLCRTVAAIWWRHANSAQWRAVPEGFGHWHRAAVHSLGWVPRSGGVILSRCRRAASASDKAFINGTSVGAHAKAADAAQKGLLHASKIAAKYLADLATNSAARLPARSLEEHGRAIVFALAFG